jgi:hypothetical protein
MIPMYAFLLDNFKSGKRLCLYTYEVSHEASKAHTLNKQSKTADKVQSSGCGLREEVRMLLL